MTTEQFLTRMEEIYAANLEISRKKNADYTGDKGPFGNFQVSEVFGIPVEKAILVRMSDKMSRVASLLDREAQVLDESLLDTLSDLCNYSAILRIWLEQQKS